MSGTGAVLADATVVAADPNVVVFDYPTWMACYPEFSAVTQPRAQMFFDIACTFCDNTACSPVPAQSPRATYLNMLTAHVAALSGGLTACGVVAGGGGGAAPVGRIASATEGSVTVSFDYGMTADGLTMSSNGQSYNAKFDDKQYLTQGDPSKTMVNLKKVSDTEVLETDSRGGKPVETEDMTISADGKTMHVVDTTLYNKSVQHYDLAKQP